MPAKPTSSPTTWRSVSGSPSGVSASMPTIQNGAVETSTAVRPLETVRSAHTTPPLPKPRRRAPSTARAPQDRADERAGDDPPEGGHEEGRDRLERDPDPEIRCAPDQAHRDPRQVRSPP